MLLHQNYVAVDLQTVARLTASPTGPLFGFEFGKNTPVHRLSKNRQGPACVVSQGEAIEGFFPATAMPDADWWEALWPQPAKVLADLGIEPSMDVIDLCCGDGLFTAPLADMVRHVIAIDIDPQMLDLARARVAEAGVANCDYIQGDAYAVADLVHRPVDFVLMANTFHGVPDKPRLARAVATILKPGGRFAIVNWHQLPREETKVLGQQRGPQTEMRMSPADVARTVETAPLRLAGVVELPPYHYGAIFREALGMTNSF